MKCIKCDGEMEKGMSVDIGQGARQASWGTKINKIFGFIYFGLEDARNIDSYRCKKCGYLESYAV